MRHTLHFSSCSLPSYGWRVASILQCCSDAPGCHLWGHSWGWLLWIWRPQLGVQTPQFCTVVVAEVGAGSQSCAWWCSQTMQARQLAPHAHAFNALINATGRAFRLGDVAGLVRGAFHLPCAPATVVVRLTLCLLELVSGLAPCEPRRQ